MGEIDIIFERKALRNCSKADLTRMGEFHVNLAALYLVEGEFLRDAGLLAPETDSPGEMWRADAMEESLREFRSSVGDRLRSKIADLGSGAKESQAE